MDKHTKQLIRETKLARSRTKLGYLESLLEQRTRARRKSTEAANKLHAIESEITLIALELSKSTFEAELSKQGGTHEPAS